MRGARGTPLLSDIALRSVMAAVHQMLAAVAGREEGVKANPASESERAAPGSEQACAEALAALGVLDFALGPSGGPPHLWAPLGGMLFTGAAEALGAVFRLARRAEGPWEGSGVGSGIRLGKGADDNLQQSVGSPAALLQDQILNPGRESSAVYASAPAEPGANTVELTLSAVESAAARVWAGGARLAHHSATLAPAAIKRLRTELMAVLVEAVGSLIAGQAPADFEKARS